MCLRDLTTNRKPEASARFITSRLNRGLTKIGKKFVHLICRYSRSFVLDLDQHPASLLLKDDSNVGTCWRILHRIAQQVIN